LNPKILSVSVFVILSTSDDITKEYRILLGELKKYNPELLDKNRILAISKSDMLDDELTQEIKQELPQDIECLFISSVAQQGLVELKDVIWKKLNE
jgi:GTP-binding protein